MFSACQDLKMHLSENPAMSSRELVCYSRGEIHQHVWSFSQMHLLVSSFHIHQFFLPLVWFVSVACQPNVTFWSKIWFALRNKSWKCSDVCWLFSPSRPLLSLAAGLPMLAPARVVLRFQPEVGRSWHSRGVLVCVPEDFTLSVASRSQHGWWQWKHSATLQRVSLQLWCCQEIAWCRYINVSFKS